MTTRQPTPGKGDHLDQGDKQRTLNSYSVTDDLPTTRRTRAGPGFDTTTHDATFPTITNPDLHSNGLEPSPTKPEDIFPGVRPFKIPAGGCMNATCN